MAPRKAKASPSSKPEKAGGSKEKENKIQKSSRGKQKEKVNNKVQLEKATNDELLTQAPKYKVAGVHCHECFSCQTQSMEQYREMENQMHHMKNELLDTQSEISNLKQRVTSLEAMVADILKAMKGAFDGHIPTWMLSPNLPPQFACLPPDVAYALALAARQRHAPSATDSDESDGNIDGFSSDDDFSS